MKVNMTGLALTLVGAPLVTAKVDGVQAYEVRHGKTFLALVTFDGPRGTMRTHAGSLYAEERKEVYRLRAAQ